MRIYFRGFLERAVLVKEKRDKKVGYMEEMRLDARLPTTHTTAGNLQPSWTRR